MGRGVWVQQQLIGVEAQAVSRIIRSMHAISVRRAGHYAFHVSMPDLVRVLRKRNALDFSLARAVEKAEIHTRRVL